MNNEEMREKAFLYACGAMKDDESKSFEEEMRVNSELQEEAYAWQKVNEQSVLDIEQAELPFHTYAGVMARISEEESEVAASKSIRGSAVSFLNWGGWAIAACAVLVFALTWKGQGPAASNGPQFVVDAPKSDIVLSDLRNPGGTSVVTVSNVDNGLEDRMMEVAELAEAYWFSRDSFPADDVDQTESEQWTDGFTIFDRQYKIGFIGVENMPKARVGKFYNVWARSERDGRSVWAGSLPMGDASRGLFFFDLSNNEEIAPLDNAMSFFVTEDTTDRPDAPQGPVVLGDI